MRRRAILAATSLGCILMFAAAARAEAPVNVFAAASLQAALSAVADAWAHAGHPTPRLVLDSSGALAKQIEQGAPAQIFVSADDAWMQALDEHRVLVAGSRTDLLTNSLVLVVPAAQPSHLALAAGFNLAGLLGKTGRLSIGDPDTVPAGIYARQALTNLGVWGYARRHLAPASNVRSALLAVDRGEAPAGIVYGTDARGDSKVVVAGTFPDASHDPIVYPVARVVSGGDAAAEQELLDFLHSGAALAIFRRYGFGTR